MILVRCCDVDTLLTDLELATWHVMRKLDSIDNMWSYWKTLFFDVVERHAPLLKVRVRDGRQEVEWMDSEIHSVMRTRNYFRRKYWRSHALEDWDRYKQLRNEVRNRIRRAKADHYSRVCAEISKKPKPTWRKLNSALGRNPRSSVSLINCSGKVLTKAADIVNSFVQHFSSIHSTATTDLECHLNPVDVCFQFSDITEDTVLGRLNTLDERKATGPDKISAKLLRTVAPAVAPSLTFLFNKSISQGQFPSEWKEANVTPVPKSGNKQLLNNYRPVSVIPVLAKVFESIVHHQLHVFLESNKILEEEQLGFRANRSNQDVLLRTIDD